MLTILNNNRRPWPLIASTVFNFVLLLTICSPTLMLPVPVIKVRAPKVKDLHLIQLKSPILAELEPRGNPRAPKKSRAAESIRSADSALATPGTQRWGALVARGRNLTIEIDALESLPVLRAYGTTLAFDARRPRGESYLFSLRDKTLHRGTVPDGAVVRELDGMPTAFDEVRNRVERELGRPIRTYALYDASLYAALRALTYEALQKQGVPADSVLRVTVRLRLVGPQSFEVSIVEEAKG
jgi:hypothetical protein